jgi:uncharacterized protein YndB with AHSA1/START domain
MNENLVAQADVTIDAPAGEVWQALVSPDAIKQYMFGTTVDSQWTEGSRITWKGDWKGKPYEDKGVILQVKPGRVLQYSHFSPLAGLPDKPENYHTVTVELTPEGGRTHVALSQDNNSSEDAKAHSEQNWQQMLDGLKKYAEKR